MSSKPGLTTALLRGLFRKCPCCGKGKAFRGYLKIVDVCDTCQTPLGLYPCDDGPAYITMLLVGHVVIAPLFIFESLWSTHIEVLLPIAMFSLGLLTLIVLPFIKGAFLGLLWHHGLKQGR
jgi:uncharacterized protein (DUF983 family)